MDTALLPTPLALAYACWLLGALHISLVLLAVSYNPDAMSRSDLPLTGAGLGLGCLLAGVGLWLGAHL